MPGVEPAAVDIRVKGNILTIRGEMAAEREAREENFVRRERRFGRFFRQVALPTTVLPDRAEATFDNGVLTIKLPKAEQTRPRQIPVRSAGQAQTGGQIPAEGQRRDEGERREEAA